MKKYSKYIAFAALALTFAACTQEEDFTPQTDGDAVKITANIGKIQSRVSYEDNGATTFVVDDKIRVQNTLRTSKNIASYTLTGEGWNTTDAFVWNSTSSNQFQAWYPVTDDTSFDTFTLPTEQNTSALLAAADWMTASTDEITKPENNTLNLAFEHRLAKVTVTVTKWNSEFDGSEKLISGQKIWSKGKDVTVSYGTGDEGADVYTSEGTLTEITPMVSGQSFTAIVAPVKYDASDKLMTFTVDEQAMTVLAKANQLTDGLEAGQHYTFNLTVGKNVAEITSVSVNNWTEKPVTGVETE